MDNLQNRTTMASSDSAVAAFYSGSRILVTGVSGFIGRLLVEKLLRSCPDLDRIYVIVRKKKGKDSDERLRTLLEGPEFDVLRKEQPDFQSKLQPILGDISYENLGLQSADRELLINNVSVVFHCAATISFSEHLRRAVNTNVRGTRALLALCAQMPRLKSLVHVSTAYAFCPYRHLEEVHYRPPLHPDTIIQLVNQVDLESAERITPGLFRQDLKEWPNSYTFTKAISEQLVEEYEHKLPVGIFRPSIVLHTAKEPIPNWLDNMYSPIGFGYLVVLGLMHVNYSDNSMKMNIVPADFCVNALLATGERVGREFEMRLEARKTIFNMVSDPKSTPLIWHYTHWGMLDYALYPPSKAVYHHSIIHTTKDFVYYPLMILLQFVPALLVDLVRLLKRKKPKYCKFALHMHKFSLVMKYFGINEWHMTNDNMRETWNSLSDTDKKLFPFDMENIDWKSYLRGAKFAAKKYMMKEETEGESLKLAKEKYSRLLMLHRVVKSVSVIVFLYLLYKCFM